MTTPLYIFDLDGTPADCTHRLHYIQRDSPNWDAFYEACGNDKPIRPVIRVLQHLAGSCAEIWVFSGRSDAVRETTMRWLAREVCCPWLETDSRVVMRPAGDHRPDDELKQLFVDRMLDVDRQRLVAVFDDRDRVVKMWRRNGIQCFQVNDGNF